MTVSRYTQGQIRRAPGAGLTDALPIPPRMPQMLPTAALPVQVQFLDAPAWSRLRAEAAGRFLGEVHFGAGLAASAAHPVVRLDMPPLGPALVEVWLSAEPVSTAQEGDFVLARNTEVLFGYVTDAVEAASHDFEETVRRRYRELLALIEAQGYPHLLRIWNYFPDINTEFAGLEVYQRFSRGRYHAFEEHYGTFHDKLPAASAVGTRRGGLHVYFIASRTPGVYRENPRQVSAYRYPPQYGPRSPSFARATFKRWGEAEVLFISGTASIVGHESRHHGDPLAQFEETLRNIDALIEVTARDEAAALHGLSAITGLKIYLREPHSYALLKPRLEAVFGPSVPALYLRGDICRRDLLVEIEGLALGG